jgi:alpha-1,2-mannosyltransferase
VNQWAGSRAGRVTIVVVLALVALGGHLWYGLRNQFFDLMIYRDAMLWWSDGHPLYDFAKPDATQGQLGFTYPPVGAYLLRPLSWLTANQAKVLFVGLAVAALAASIWWLVRPIADKHHWPRWFTFGIAFILATGLEPIRLAFDFGQINFVLWALIVFDLAVLAPRRSRFFGIGIGLATAIKLIPGIFILYLLVTRRWRAFFVSVGVAVGATLVAAALDPSATATFWTEKLLYSDGVGQLDYVMNQSLNGLLARLSGGEPSTVVWLVLALPVLGYGMFRARQAYLAGDDVAGMALTGFTGSLVSPVTWGHHIFWFVPALLVLVDAYASTRRRAYLWIAVFTYTTVTFSMLQWWDFTLQRPGGPVGFVLSNWLVLLMLVLLAVLPTRPAKIPLTSDLTGETVKFPWRIHR